MPLDRSNLTKLVLGTLLVGAGTIPAGGVLGTLLAGAGTISAGSVLGTGLTVGGSVGANWLSEALGTAFDVGPPPDVALRKAFVNAVREAAGELRKEYGTSRIKSDGSDGFSLLRESASGVTELTMPPATTDIIAVQRALRDSLGQLLHGHNDAQVLMIREQILPRTAECFQRELARNADAWRLYHGWILQRMLAQNTALQAALTAQPATRAVLSDPDDLERRFDRFEEQLAALLADLREQLLAAAHGVEPADVSLILRVQGTAEGNRQEADEIEGRIEEVIEAKEARNNVQIARRIRRPVPAPPTSLPAVQPVAPELLLAARLSFAPNPLGAAIRWGGANIGERESRFTSPFQGDDLDLVLKALDILQYPSTSFTTTEIERFEALGIPHLGGMLTQDAPPAIGKMLFRALTADVEAAKALGSLRDQAAKARLPLQLGLHFPLQAVELAALPWELLWEPNEPAPLLLSRVQTGSLTRHLNLAQPALSPRTDRAPLRVLAVAPKTNLSDEMHAAERAARQAIWQPLIDRGEVELLPDLNLATRVALSDTLRQQGQIDVLHYIGHGRFKNGQGYLVLDKPGGGIDPTPIAEIASTLSRVQLAVLTACQGAMVGAGPADIGIVGGVAPALIHAGVDLVVAMQFTVRQAAANRATGVIYERLATGDSIQAAVAAARLDLRTTENGADDASWYVPTLYMRQSGDQPARLRGSTGAQHDGTVRPTTAA